MLTPSPGGSRPGRRRCPLVPGTGPDMPVTLPAADGLAGSITRVAAIMRQRKTPPRATSVTLPGPLFRLLAPTGYCAAACGDPIPNTTGNIPVTFAALSYAGTLRLTVLSGPAQVPDAEMLTAAMRQELSSASGPGGDIDSEPPRAQNIPVCTGTWPLDLDPKPRVTAAMCVLPPLPSGYSL